MKKLKAKTDARKGLGVPGRIYDIDLKKQKTTPKKIAEGVLKKIAPELKIDADLSQLKYEEVKESILGKHVLYQQQEQGKPISGAWIRVDIDKEGKVYNIQNDLVPRPVIEKAAKLKAKKSKAAPKLIKEAEAKKIALDASGVKGRVKGTVKETEQTWYAKENVPVQSWKVIVIVEKPKAQWKYYIDAHSGEVIEKLSLIKAAKPTGLVFDPNPIVKLNGKKLKERSKIPEEAYVKVELLGLKKTGYLDGAYVTTKNTVDRVKRPSLKFHFKREERPFKEVMAYYHIDRMQRYLQDLGFDNILNKPIPVDIDGEPTDNSYYFVEDKSLQFGLGAVPDAEDAEVIIHEYGHAIQDAQVPGFGLKGEAGGMGEGFGDYLAASFYANNKPASFRPTFGTWDGYFDGDGTPKCVRRLDSKRKYSKNLVKADVHDIGEVWSSCLWEIRTALGGKQTDKLVIAHHFLLNRKPTFIEAAKALITADKQLNKGANEKMLTGIFVKRGVLPKTKKKNK